jgi:hypothetical protein
MTETERTRKRFWKGFYHRLDVAGNPFTVDISLPRSTHYFPTKLPKSGYRVVFNAYKRNESIGYALNVPHTDRVWNEFQEREDEIEDHLGEVVELAGPKYDNDSQIYTVRISRDESIFGIEDEDREQAKWCSYYDWYIDQGERCWDIVQNLHGGKEQ